MPVHSRKSLQAKSLEEVLSLALNLDLQTTPDASKADLIQMILEAQEGVPPLPQTQDDRPDDDASGFSSPLGADDASGFSSPLQNEASGFSSPLDGQASGFSSASEGPASDQSSFNRSDDPDGQSGFTSTGSEVEAPDFDPNIEVLVDPSLAKSHYHNLGKGDEVELNGVRYTLSSILSEASGEAVIYRVNNAEAADLVLKLYQKIDPRQRPEPNSEALRRIAEIDHPDILRLHDFGTQDKKYQGKYCFEISTYAAGGDLLDVTNPKDKYTPEFVENHLIAEIFKGICTLHDHRIIHCDLKPQNIFYLDKGQSDLVIGDYGSAKTFEMGSEDEGKQFSMVIGTKAYQALEQHQGIISEKNDYYSFGMILLHLFYPEYFAQDKDFRRWDRDKVRRINENQHVQGEVIPFDPQYERINQLIGGLTMSNHNVRWGREEVEKWLRQEYVPVRYQGKSIVEPIKVGYPGLPEIVTEAQLLQAIANYPQQWYEDLIEDEQSYKRLLGWMGSRTNIPTRKAFDQMIRQLRPLGKWAVAEGIQRFFEPRRPLTLAGKAFDLGEAAKIEATLTSLGETLDAHWREQGLEGWQQFFLQVEFACKQLIAQPVAHQGALTNLLEKMAVGLGIGLDLDFRQYQLQFPFALSPDSIAASGGAVLQVLHQLYPNRGFRDGQGTEIATPQGLGIYFAQHPAAFEGLNKLEALAFLAKHGINARPYIRNRDQFLFFLLQDQVKSEVDLKKLRVSQGGEYHFGFTSRKSLTEFLRSQGVKEPLETQASDKQEMVFDKPWHKSPKFIWNAFFEQLGQRAGITETQLSQQNRAQLQRRFWLRSMGQEAWHFFKDGISGLVLLFPFAVLGAMLIGRNDEGVSLLGQFWYQVSQTDDFHWAAMGSIAGLCILWLMLALIPKLWLGKNLALAGEVHDGSSPIFHLRGQSWLIALGYGLIGPGLFGALLEFHPIVAAVVLGFIGWLLHSYGKKRKLQLAKTRVLAYGLLLMAAVNILAFVQDQTYYLDSVTLLIFGFGCLLLFVLPILYQHGKPQTGLGKYASLIILVPLILGLYATPMQLGPVYKPSLFSERINWADLNQTQGPEDATELVPGFFIGQITNGFSAMNLRQGPTTQSPVLGTLKAGEPFLFEKTEDQGGWWRVHTQDGRTGYLYENKVKTVKQATQQDARAFRLRK